LKVEIDMANKRDPRKKMVGLWLSPEELADFNTLAQRLGLNRSELLRRLVSNIVSPARRTK
jgi:hypothetical protein